MGSFELWWLSWLVTIETMLCAKLKLTSALEYFDRTKCLHKSNIQIFKITDRMTQYTNTQRNDTESKEKRQLIDVNLKWSTYWIYQSKTASSYYNYAQWCKGFYFNYTWNKKIQVFSRQKETIKKNRMEILQIKSTTS